MSLAPSPSDSRATGRAHAATAVVGPNAAIQLIGVLRARTDPETLRRILAAAGVPEWEARPPDRMVDERPVAALHRATRAGLDAEPGKAILTEAGSRTGDYILANRIPAAARAVLKPLPSWLSSRLLARAIATHAWTFVGSGRFRCDRGDGLAFEIAMNPFCAGESSADPVCVWHAAVFRRLFDALVSRNTRVVETHCCARGDPCCRFALSGIGK
ncbi:divinyl protochlorophyllide a 8-vinyl-reductase [Roseiarcus fermentans]|uniref:Divinyl protochlorophyllide a 8-vinyl-reductase n=2 Tax=Roseiarcus fermentans TaxID=1473586 RepID=A0A366F9N4_9HYPH|nr:divinyl protochlorophyllide a 8-vinyl-reductase [Roseiarcus fermentans]